MFDSRLYFGRIGGMEKLWFNSIIVSNGILWLVALAMQIGGWVSQCIASILLGIALLWTLAFVLYRLKRRKNVKEASNKKVTIEVENPRYDSLQRIFTIELEVNLRCPHIPIQSTYPQLLIVGKPHDYINIQPPFKDMITTEWTHYKVWYELTAHDFMLGGIRNPLGQISVTIGGMPIVSLEFEIKSKREISAL
jgi:hypothetical protein